MATDEQIKALDAKGGDLKKSLHKNELYKLKETARVAGPHGQAARDALTRRGEKW